MLIWQVVGRDFYSINLHYDSIVLGIYVNVTDGKSFNTNYF